MDYIYSFIIVLSTLLFSVIGTKLLIHGLQYMSIIDTPNERGNHSTPTPRGGGIAVSVAMIGFLTVIGTASPIIVAAIILAVVSFLDDLHGLSALLRLAFHIAAAILASTGIDGLLFQGLLPEIADKAVMVILWVGFLNFYNFMDGIDELTATETVCISLGTILLTIAAWGAVPPAFAIEAVIVIAAMGGFWWYNRHPAQIFLGDVGSVPVGFIMGYFLFTMASMGYWASALILPAYYYIDAGLTLGSRLMRGEKIWHAHSEHGYQKAVRSGLNHYQVSRRIGSLNMLLIVLAATLPLVHGHQEMLKIPAQFVPFIDLAAVAFAWIMALSLRTYFCGMKPANNAAEAHHAS